MNCNEVINFILQGVKVFPVLGTAKDAFEKGNKSFEKFFDVAFVSNRSAQMISDPFFSKIMKSSEISELESSKGLVAVETSKFIVPVTKQVQSDFTKKIEDYGITNKWIKIAPKFPRRRRDEEDKEDDVIFFRT